MKAGFGIIRGSRTAWPLAVLALAAPMPVSAQAIFGKWLTDDRSAIVEIHRCGRELCGRIDRVLDPQAPENDVNNPDPGRRSNPLVGTTILTGFAGAGARWEDGRAYDPKAGRSYRSSLDLLDGGKLKVTGCVLLFCRSRYWTRAD